MSRRIYAVATGQNHANLPPILSVAEQGDLVVWLETPLARQRRWVAGANEVLRRRHIQQTSIELEDADVHSPRALARRILDDLSQHPNAEAVFVLNGGQKHMVLGVGEARQGARLQLVYSDVRPAQLWVLAPEDSAFHAEALRNPLTFDEFLLATGLSEAPGTTSCLVWSHNGGAQVEPAVSYAQAGPIKLPVLRSWMQTNPELRARWQDLVDKAIRNTGVRLGVAQRLELVQRLGSVDSTLFTATEAFFRHAMQQVLQQQASLGKQFEQSVARAVARFLTENPDLARPVVEVRQGLVVAKRETPELTFAEYDVAILLENAMLIHLECKSGALDEKDLFARLAKLREVGGQAAQQVLCVPLRTEPADQLAHTHETLQRLQRLCQVSPNFQLLVYTEPGQAPAYEVEGQRYEFPTFEQGLRQLLAPFRPEVARGPR